MIITRNTPSAKVEKECYVTFPPVFCYYAIHLEMASIGSKTLSTAVSTVNVASWRGVSGWVGSRTKKKRKKGGMTKVKVGLLECGCCYVNRVMLGYSDTSKEPHSELFRCRNRHTVMLPQSLQKDFSAPKACARL